eukprot:CAMPEP_0204911458 /NCGR_PEP_ID=MMETSP1397-20131031/9804_1 /ASSEMBLY_ACC=CAM_ASM_000891 /TAXON_ID=49980 /ORGANISM="Climacostomum Climacostomum virens, Strain Stock W-24" /LENGTH=188 /DNA_ID=CAMNT_0052082019 /DNA_START=499 /DNA_END=1066 /DNA_ORIENTATION=+
MDARLLPTKVSDTSSAENDRLKEVYEINDSGVQAYIAVSTISLCISVLIAVADLHLIGLHLFLRCKGMTTYEYILRLREKQLAKEADLSKYENAYEPYVLQNQKGEDASMDTSLATLKPQRKHGYKLARNLTTVVPALQETGFAPINMQEAIEEEDIEEDCPKMNRVKSAVHIPENTPEQSVTLLYTN